jgi:hypothetical protein
MLDGVVCRPRELKYLASQLTCVLLFVQAMTRVEDAMMVNARNQSYANRKVLTVLIDVESPRCPIG